ncbi:serine/threonine-protein kinase [Streptomyces ochraceiscleroticus]|uniref:serine/threonine-protein kinase n=1 Tax=Streptomyces ochraceiscleroticus TaxID=47761 RepID=UPI0007C4B27E|nr:serine/threonine-protein kinase [Streptomyces ochraceiscleroticus]
MDTGAGNERVLAGRYRLLDELGRGGMGAVWRARDELLGREVAVKEVRVPRELPAHEERLLYARLEREGRAAARIAHRNVVTVFDVVTESGRPWVVMELVRGLSLAEALAADGPLSPMRAARIGAEVLAALRVAHAAGVLHRDVKPGNVLLANDGRVVLTDFGIATVEGSSALTLTGELIGSPEFLAPERALGRTPGPESDLWSLGVMLYAAVEGAPPFHEETPLGTMRALVDEELPPPRRAGPLAPVLAGLLRKDPRERLAAEEAAGMLAAVASGGQPATVTAAAPPLPYSPTLAAPGPAEKTVASGRAPGAPPPGTYGPHAAPPPRRRRRSAVGLAATALAVALAAGGAAWALLGGNGGPGPGAADRTASASARPGSSAGQDAERGYGSEEPGADGAGEREDGDGGGRRTAPPAVTVAVVVSTVRGSYTGSCPPAAGAAPAFSAVITVSRGPAEVVYRWRSDGERGHDGNWRRARFPGHGSQRVTVGHTETAYEADGTRAGRVGVQVRSPKAVASNRAAFSLTCEREAPGGGASPAPSSPEPVPTDTPPGPPPTETTPSPTDTGPSPTDTGPSPTYGGGSPSGGESAPSEDEGSASRGEGAPSGGDGSWYGGSHAVARNTGR